MNFLKLKLTFFKQYLTFTLMVVVCLLLLGMPIANAEIDSDRFEGNIFVLYAGNGSLVPSKVTLAQSIAGAKPTILVYYVDDSSDCKQYAIVVSNMQAFYGRAADIIPVNVDAIPVQSSYTPTEAGYYYKDIVPQVVILDKAGKLVFDKQGQVPYEEVDDKLREVFNLVPRLQSKELKLRPVNEFNNELVEQSTK
ncbi:thylakoid membrane photosystem I accumulation factor [Synechocystis sp. PCC 7509]|uniref:thylakoid membrane photosystem I accumulation factor n=1 Tax=Synechocystis sp. PCC 7509 TaxID=927677 RepID=UPI00048D740E|nr:thylakoid membrane photosystem I accumulation factor [Synechocystis sp. PCC 7509]